MARPTTLRVRVEERAVELQALAQDAHTTAARLVAYDARENDAHLALRYADDRTADILEQQLVAGDVWEAAQLARIRQRAEQLAAEGFALAGDITRLLEARGQAELFPVEAPAS